MAQLYPDFAQISKLKIQPTEGEHCLLTFLHQNLDNSYEIYFQPFLNGDRPDIVIMRKKSGVLVIEVKDWNLNNYYIDSNKKWRLQSNSAFIASPLEQVQSYKENLFNLHIDDLLAKKLEDSKVFAMVSCAVYFHRHSELEAKNICKANYIEILGYDSLNEQRLQQLLHTCWLDRTSQYFTSHFYESFKRYLMPPMHTREEGREIKYWPKQKALIESRTVEQKIRGVAGSGKTEILAKRAVNAHIRTGSRVLILTFNITLRNYIHDRVSKVRETFGWKNFYFTHYHLFFKIEANNYNLKIKSLQDFSNLDFFASVEQDIIRYDAIFIDEIQDYETDWIRIIKRYFLAPGGELVVFGDEKQNLYGRALAKDRKPNTTIPGRWNELTDSFRSNWKIINLAFDFQDYFFNGKYDLDEIDVAEQLDLFKEPQYVEYIDKVDDLDVEQLFDIIDGTAKKQAIHPNDITILATRIELLRELDFFFRTKGHENTATTFESQEDYEKLENNLDSQRDIDNLRRNKKFNFWANSGTIKLATIHSFKGWEVHTLFLVIEKELSESEELGYRFTSEELIYTAVTRCRQNLIVINLGNEKYQQFFRQKVSELNRNAII